MKTKLIANIAAAFCLTLLASCQEVHKVKVAVVEEDGKTPVAGANVEVRYLGYGSRKEESVFGETDGKGVFASQGAAKLAIGIFIDKPGYYKTKSDRLSRKKDHDLTFVLRRIRNPIPMYAKRLDLIPPEPEKWIGYDVEAGDWVAPYGKGQTSDFEMKTHSLRDNDEFEDFHHEFQIRFPNKHDGFVTAERHQDSVFQSPYLAPEKADYKSDKTIYIKRKPGGPRLTNNEPNRCYVLRLRTKVDANGNIVSCHYGKTYGDFLDFKCYFNPTPNDRNLEFDPEKNLFKHLKAEEWPHDP